MTVMNVVDPRLEWFVGKMREKLALPRNQAKGDWRTEDVGRIYALLDNERRELEEAIMTNNKEKIVEECADLANFAMMVADMVRFEPTDCI